MMRKVFHFCFFLVLFSLAGISNGSDCAAQIVVNEFLADPAQDWDGDGALNSRDDEWIEIANLGRNAVDLAGLRLSDGMDTPVWRYEFAGILEAGGVRIVYGSDAEAWEESNGFSVFGLSLNNSGDRIALYRISGADTALVDEYTFAEVAARDDRAIGRRADIPSEWMVFDAYNPCTTSCDPAGTGCYPSPGAHNTCLTAIESRTWGSIKAIYR